MRLGTVTYNLAKDWDIPTIIKNCEATGFEAVELRTEHAHGVEPTLTAQQRAAVKEQFARSKVKLLSLGSTCEFQATDATVVQQNIETCKKFVVLAHDIDAMGVKVRPNGFPRDADRAKTLRQIGEALRACGEFAKGYGVEIWLEVHGSGTQDPPNIRTIMDVCNHPSVGVCWNSNPTDVVNGSVKQSFGLLSKWIRNCHITELHSGYPYREFFALLKGMDYQRYTLAEIPTSCEPERLMKYYRDLWKALQAT